ncbi:MAG: glycosyltransferase family 4 protein [Rickettsiales bacterium]
MKRLLFFVNDAAFFVADSLPIAIAARDAGFEVHILAPPHPQSEQRFTEESLQFHSVQLSRKGINPFAETLLLLRIIHTLKQIQPDIIHNMTIKPVIYGGLAARIASINAMSSTITGMGYIMSARALKASILRTMVMSLYPLAFDHPNAKIIFQNPDDQDFFIRKHLVKSEQAMLIRGAGVNLETFSPSLTPPSPPIRVTLVARYIADKGIREFITAARLLKQKRDDICFTLVGSPDAGNPTSLSSGEIDKAVAEGIIENLGQRDDIASIYHNTHIACLPSYREGLPKSLMEAAACGLPIVTTNVAGCREVVEHNKNGLLVPARDVDALSTAIETLANDEEIRLRMGKYSRQKAEKEFSQAAVVQANLSMYKLLLS